MKSILMLIKNNPWTTPGGAEIFVREISKKLSKNNLVHIVCEGLEDKTEYVDDILVHTYKTSNIPKIRALESMYKLFKTTEKVIKNYQFDVINSHIVFPTGYIGYYLAKKYKIRSIFSAHDASDSSIYKQSRYNLFYNYFVKTTITKSDKIHIVSEYSRTFLNSYFSNISNKCVVVSPGLDKNIFNLKKFNTKRKKNSIICISNFHKLFTTKRQDLLILSAKKLIQKYPTISIIFVGDGNMEPLKTLSKKINLKKSNLSFLGKFTHNDIAKILSETEIFAFPTNFESFGMVAIEAMSMGTVPIVPNIPPFDEYISDQKEGLFVELSADGFYEGIDTLLSNRELLSHLSKNAILKSNKYTWLKISKKYENMLFS
ncbi:MAG: glycosyltransferase family 4 protein [DPANN group archaeon]|nr:glycosyltransferase family 4 protein [DPANN group archaeon]